MGQFSFAIVQLQIVPLLSLDLIAPSSYLFLRNPSVIWTFCLMFLWNCAWVFLPSCFLSLPVSWPCLLLSQSDFGTLGLMSKPALALLKVHLSTTPACVPCICFWVLSTRCFHTNCDKMMYIGAVAAGILSLTLAFDFVLFTCPASEGWWDLLLPCQHVLLV